MFYFFRHGQSHTNTTHQILNKGVNLGLTAIGEDQVTTAAEILRNINFAACYSSPLLRATQSADIIAKSLHIHYNVSPALKEYDVGKLERHSDEESWKRYRKLFEDWLRGASWNTRLEGGESFIDMQNRFTPFINEVKRDYAGKAGAVLFIGHGGVYRCMLPLILSNVTLSFSAVNPIRNMSCVIAELNGDRLECLRWGDSDFRSL